MRLSLLLFAWNGEFKTLALKVHNTQQTDFGLWNVAEKHWKEWWLHIPANIWHSVAKRSQLQYVA